MKISKLIKLLNSSDNGEKLIIPEYQRDYVWNGTSHVSLLLDSIYGNFPIGSIMIWKENGNNILIDGLQRSFSIYSIRQIPFKYLSIGLFSRFAKNNKFIIKDGDEVRLEKLFALLNKTILNKNEYNDFEKRKTKSTRKISEFKLKFDQHLEINSFVRAKIKDMALDEYEKQIFSLEKWIKGDGAKQFGGKEVNVIEINDIDENEIPDIFERINSNGKKLSKYEIYSSTWSNSKITLDVEPGYLRAFIEKRMNRYRDSLNIEKIEVTESLAAKTYNPSNILYAIFYEVIKDKDILKNLFMQKDVISDINTLSYIMAKYLKIDSTKKFSRIGPKLKTTIGGSKSILDQIVFDINKAFVIVERSIKMFNFLSNDGTDDKINFKKIKISEHLIVSFINTILKIEQDCLLNKESLNSKQIRLKRAEKIRRAENGFKYWFIIEGLKKEYSSATGSKGWKFAGDGKYLSEDENSLREIVKTEIDSYIKSEKKLKKKNTFSKSAVLILAVIQNNASTKSNIRNHVDHVIPKSKLSGIVKSKYIHSIFNLQLLSASDNEKKSNQISAKKMQWDWLLVDSKLPVREKNIYLDCLKRLETNVNEKDFKKILKIREKAYSKILEEKTKLM